MYIDEYLLWSKYHKKWKSVPEEKILDTLYEHEKFMFSSATHDWKITFEEASFLYHYLELIL